MKYLSVCSGIEAATCAWHHMGWKPEAFSEIEPFPSAVLAHHYPDTPNLGDMTKYKEWNLGAIDLLVGGTPCQSFSVAGLRKGLDDPRGNLMLTFGSIARHFSPRWLVWENVPGVLSSNGGRDFGSFLGMLGELGYGFAYRVLDAQWFGVAQRRRRVFVVGYLGDWRPAAAVLFELESLSGNPKPSREKGKAIALGFTESVDERGLQRTVGTLCADTHLGAYSGQDAYTGRLVPCSTYDMKQHHNPQESDTVQLTTQNWSTIRGDTPLVQFIGCDTYNGQLTGDVAATLSTKSGDGLCSGPTVMQPIPLDSMAFGRDGDKDTRYGLGVGEPGQPSFTLTKAQSHAVAQPIAFHATQDPISGSVAPALGSNMYAGVAQPISIQGNLIGREAGGPQGVGASDEGVMYTLTKADVHGVAQPMAVHENQRSELTLSETVGTVTCSGGKPGQGYPAVMQPTIVHGTQDPCVSDIAFAQGRNSGGENVMVQSMAVRRLTPRECERLQGFRDDYTLISWRGKEAPDGPRYKALGNSMAVPVMRWIGERIESLRLLQG